VDNNEESGQSQKNSFTGLANENVMVKSHGIESMSKELVQSSAAINWFNEMMETEICEIEREKKLVGIENKNLTCYINAVIQILFNCKK